MALSLTQTTALSTVLEPVMMVASMGYPDIIATYERLHELFGDHEYEPRADSEAICSRHGMKNRPIVDAHSFFKVHGCDLHVYDVVRERGCEIICDLNVWQNFQPTYDIVLDVGTAEHCFNIGQALINMASLVKRGGYIIHENPFQCPNHGFYNLNPTLFADFYNANGFEVMECKLAGRDGNTANVPYTKRFKYNGGECNVFAMARRNSVQPFRFPVQSKYAHLIPAAGERAKEAANG